MEAEEGEGEGEEKGGGKVFTVKFAGCRGVEGRSVCINLKR